MRDVDVWLLVVSFALGAGLTWLATVRRVTVEVPARQPAQREVMPAPERDGPPDAPVPVAAAAPALAGREEVYDVDADLGVVDDVPPQPREEAPEPSQDQPPTGAVDAAEAARVGVLGAAGAGAAPTLGIPDVEIYGVPAAMEPVDLPEAEEELPPVRVQAPSWQGPLEPDEERDERHEENDRSEPLTAEPTPDQPAPEPPAAADPVTAHDPVVSSGDTTAPRTWDEQIASVRRARRVHPDAGREHLGP